MSNRAVIERFHEWSLTSDAIALATVVNTEGSTYSKAGRQILICADGNHAGLLSGGCLEGDLAEHARSVIANGQPLLVTYDMRDEADDLWGIGLGCNGLMQILLQRITKAENWQPFDRIASAMAADTGTVVALTTASTHAELVTGSVYMQHAGNDWNGSTPLPDSFVTPPVLPAHREYEIDGHPCSFLLWQIRPWPRLLILGAGPDSLPVLQIARSLGWEVTVADHRAQYFAAHNFSAADAIAVVHPNSLADELELANFAAVVVMSHHLESDRNYLRQLAAFNHPYVGILGPAARKAKLLDDLALTDSEFGRRLSGPVGLDIGADSPETIALALLAEIQSRQPTLS